MLPLPCLRADAAFWCGCCCCCCFGGGGGAVLVAAALGGIVVVLWVDTEASCDGGVVFFSLVLGSCLDIVVVKDFVCDTAAYGLRIVVAVVAMMVVLVVFCCCSFLGARCLQC